VRVLREGAVSREQLRDVLGDLLEPDPGAEPDADAADAPAEEAAAPEAPEPDRS